MGADGADIDGAAKDPHKMLLVPRKRESDDRVHAYAF
jgi:hypothetical protein